MSTVSERRALGTPPLAVFIIDGYTSHFHSTTGLARQLQHRGWRVAYWGHAAAMQAVLAQQFAFRELKGIWPFYERMFPRGLLRSLFDRQRIRPGLASLRNRARAMRGALERFERSVTACTSEETPSLAVFHPFVLPYFPFLRARGIPCVVLQDKPIPLPDANVPPPTSGMVPRRSGLGKLLCKLCWVGFWCAFIPRQLESRILQVLASYHPDDLLRAIEQRTGAPLALNRVHRGLPYDLSFNDVPEWLLEAPQFDLPRTTALPSRIRYIGHAADSQRMEAHTDIVRRGDARYFVYVSMGTASAWSDTDFALLRTVIAGLQAIPGVQMAVSAGSERACEALKSEFPNIDCFAFLPQLRLLRLADLAVTHCGANTVHECILTGTPMLTFPREYDQPANAARVIYHTIGLRGSRRWDSATSIRRKALRILTDESFRHRVDELRTRILAAEPSLLSEALTSVVGNVA